MTNTIEIQTDQYGRPDPKSVADLLSKVANTNAEDFAKISALMLNDHRTLQQGMAGFALLMVNAFAVNADSGYVDGRNEFSAKVCQRLRDVLRDEFSLVKLDGTLYWMPVV